jgi:hypothetical protein
MPASEFINRNLMGGDITRKNYTEMDDEINEISSESDIQDENTLDGTMKKAGKKMQ